MWISHILLFSLKIISNFANFVLNQINYSGFFTNRQTCGLDTETFYLSSSSITLDLTRQDEFVKGYVLIFKKMGN